MKRKITTLMAMLLAFALLISAVPITASAETTYTPIGGSTTIVKNLIVDDNTNIPDITFNYTITSGTPQDATATTIEILASTLGGETIGNAVFSNADTASAIPGVPSDTDPTNPTAGKKYAQKSVSITFPDGTFTKPGVYRFVINETNDNVPGVTYDSKLTRYLDVFVIADSSNVLSVDSYALRDAATDIGTDGKYVEDPGVKSSGYTNSLTQYNFDFSKKISGNQGDKNKRFKFTLTITDANPGTYPIIATDVEGNPNSITVGANGRATAEYSLTDSSSVKIIGLNKGAVCTVTEDAENYTATHSLDNGTAVSGDSSGAITLTDSDHSVAFTNTREGIIPTGVIMAIAPFAIGYRRGYPQLEFRSTRKRGKRRLVRAA